MTRRERIQAAVAGREVDRPPIALWRHFPEQDVKAEKLAQAVVAFQRKFDFDLVKVTPASGYYGDDWGLKAAYRPSREGVRTYLDRPIKKPADWGRLKSLDVTAGAHGREIHAIGLIARELGAEAHVLQTVFSPLAIARTLCGEHALVRYVRENPEDVHRGLEIIAAVTARFVQENLAAGADGIFFATQCAARGYLTEEEYETFGRPYDLRVLEAAGNAELILLHVHGTDIMFDLLTDYPAHIINWHDRRTAPTLAEARRRYSGCLAGGINEYDTLSRGTPEQVKAEVKEAIVQTGSRGHLVAAGCVTLVDTPEANIRAAVEAVRMDSKER
ncbi:MAG: uroporphyrinogen decarboxylase [Armatimonadetes bacterium]|nr:uroporphyrinogen decarboxylase [Armatimonadota bacterium]